LDDETQQEILILWQQPVAVAAAAADYHSSFINQRFER
jgi:hypothetical protein